MIIYIYRKIFKTRHVCRIIQIYYRNKKYRDIGNIMNIYASENPRIFHSKFVNNLKYVYSDWIESFWIIHVSDGTIFQNLNMECEK